MYNKMKFDEKMNYLYSILKVPIIILLLSIPFFLFFKGNEVELLLAFDLFLLIVSLILILRNYYIFTKDVQITDGYIDERWERTRGDSRYVMGVAKTIDGSKKTKAQRIPFWFRHGQVPVKIIIYKGKAKKYILNDESYKYADDHRGEKEKKKDKNSSIIGIIFIIFFIIMLLKFFI